MVDYYASCPYCGKTLDAGATFCSRCGKNIASAGSTSVTTSQHYQAAGTPPDVENYLVWAILATIFCCLPFGVVAIVYAAQANSALMAGNYELAVKNAENARKWCWVAFWVGLAAGLIYVLLVFVSTCAATF
ncbi:MAG TPA: CD225/dispanin family protein [Bacillota bacterium]|nr:CD225/dispanin family protein [Bacillota bacterium]